MNARLQTAAPDLAAVFVHLEERLRAARALPELRFSIANETHALLPFRQAFVWETDGPTARLATISGLAQLAATSPMQQWLERLGNAIAARPTLDGDYLTAEDVPAAIGAEWDDWLPSYLLCFPVVPADGRRAAIVAFALDDAVDASVQPWLERLPAAWGHAWGALAGRRRRVRGRGVRRAAWAAVMLALVAALFVPVRTSVLAPAEIAPLTAFAVSAPMDGVIRDFRVKPNQAVRRGDPLFTLDDTTLRSRREVALRQLGVARADAHAAAQRSFADNTSRGELATLNGRVAERQAEVASIDQLLARIVVTAPRDGVVVFGDTLDWQGKPVVTGERIALLADPGDAGVLVWLPVADAINLGEGAPLRLFLRVAPTAPLPATLVQTSYQAALSPDGIASYRLRARFDALADDDARRVRIGLAGTAKLYGEPAPLGLYLFRRPLAALREFTGW